jgi:hypothetical protein
MVLVRMLQQPSGAAMICVSFLDGLDLQKSKRKAEEDRGGRWQPPR